MSNSASLRMPELIDVPVGPTAVDVLWDALAESLEGRRTIAPVPMVSSALPLPVVSAIRDAVRAEEPVPEEIAAVVSTSGSTGSPRGVMLSSHALTSMSTTINALAGGDPTWVLAIPPTSIGGLNVMIRAQATGRRPVPVSSVGGAERFSAAAFAAAVTAARATDHPVAVSLVPTQLPRLLASTEGLGALSACSLILVGGAALAPQAAANCLAAGITVTTTYGMTETSGGCVLDGNPLPGVHIRVDETDRRIWISGPMLARGYRDGANEAFVDGWLRTQDRGQWLDSSLRIVGRLDDIVSIKGTNVDLVAIEDRLSDHPGIEYVVALPVVDEDTQEASIHAIFSGESLPRESLRSWVSEVLGTLAVPSTFHHVADFAFTSTGKIDRRTTADALGLTIGALDDEGPE